MAKDKFRMPASVGGLVRYYDEEYKSRFMMQPKVVVIFCIAVIVVLLALQYYFSSVA